MTEPNGILQPDEPAPDFTLPGAPHRQVSMSAFRRGPTVLAFNACSADGYAERALFVVDPAGTVTWSYLSPAGVNPGAGEILDALEGLRSRPAVRA